MTLPLKNRFASTVNKVQNRILLIKDVIIILYTNNNGYVHNLRMNVVDSYSTWMDCECVKERRGISKHTMKKHIIREKGGEGRWKVMREGERRSKMEETEKQLKGWYLRWRATE